MLLFFVTLKIKKSAAINSFLCIISTQVGNFCTASQLFSFVVRKKMLLASFQQAEATRIAPIFVALAQNFRPFLLRI